MQRHDSFSKENKNKYNAEAERMAKPERQKTFSRAYRSIEHILDFERIENVLDIGCGTGNLAQALVGLYKNYTGIDIAEKALDKAVNRRLPNTKFICEDILSLQYGEMNKLAIIAISTIDQMGNKDEALSAIRAICKSDTQVYIEVRNRNYIFKRLLRWIIPILVSLRMVQRLPSKKMVDLSYSEWVEIIQNNKFEIVSTHVSIRPSYSENLFDKIKVTLHELAKNFNVEHQYMVGFCLRLKNA